MILRGSDLWTMCRVSSPLRNTSWVSTATQITEVTGSSETMPRPWSDTSNFHPYARSTNIILRFLFQECFTSVGSFWSTCSAAWQTGEQLRVSAPLSRYSPPFTLVWYGIVQFIFYLLAEIFSPAESGVPSLTFGSQEPVTRAHCHQCPEITLDLDVKYALLFY